MGVVELQKITDEEANIIMNDCDPIEAPPGPYKIQPEVPGKVNWLMNIRNYGKLCQLAIQFSFKEIND